MNVRLFSLIMHVLLICSFATVVSVEDSHHFFYRDGNQQMLQNFISTSLSEDDGKNQDLCATFLQHVYLRHPEFFQNLDLSRLSPHSMAVITAAVASVDPNSPLLKNANPVILSQAKTIKMVAPQEWKNFVVREVGDLDLAFVSFEATGEKIYLIKALEAINQNEEALLLGYEFNNRKFLNRLANLNAFNNDDLWTAINQKEQSSPGFTQKVMVAGAGIWALESLTRQDPYIAQLLKEIYCEKQNLDYWKTIHRVLKGQK